MGLLDRFNRLNEQAMRVFAFAQDEAVRLDHSQIGTEHVLLGLIREGEGIAARVLNSHGLELSKVRAAAKLMAGRGESAKSSKEISLSPHTKKVIEHAIDEARKLGHNHIGTEHLLLGLVREGEVMKSGVLESLGVPHMKVRRQVVAMLGEQRYASTSGPSAKELKGS